MKRTLIIIAVVVVLLGVGVGLYFTFFTSKPGIVVAPPNGGGLPAAGDSSQGSTGGATDTTPNNPAPVSARLVKISQGPVAPGEAVVNKKAVNASSSPDVLVNYIERQSGNIYSYSVRSGSLTRTSNKTVPGIQSANWLPDGSLAFVRYLSGADFSTINTYVLSADGSSNTGFFLPQNLSSVAVSSSSVLTLSSGVNGSIASLAQTNGTHASEIFTTPLSALSLSFAGKGQYLAYTKPSASLPGAAFIVDAKGNFSSIGTPASGLTAKASPSGKWVIVSSSNDGTLQMSLVNTETKEALSLPVSTITDKCVWAADDSAVYCGVPMSPPSASYPDDWYQGAVSFSDRIWKIEVAGHYAQLVLDFSKETKDSLDATALSIDPLESTLVFMNKTDGSLWSYSL